MRFQDPKDLQMKDDAFGVCVVRESVGRVVGS